MVLELLNTPLAGLLTAAAAGELAGIAPLSWADGAAVTVVIAAENYPGAPVTGDQITGADVDGVLHAGTAIGPDGVTVSAGGRVLSVTAVGADLRQARERAYLLVDGISMRGGHHRSDIAAAAVAGSITVPDSPPVDRSGPRSPQATRPEQSGTCRCWPRPAEMRSYAALRCTDRGSRPRYPP